MKTFVLSTFFALSLVTYAEATTFTVRQTSMTENADGNYMAEALVKSENRNYELVPATEKVENHLRLAKCSGNNLEVTGSVLSRTIEVDHETRREPFPEAVKILVRTVSGCASGN